MRIQKVGADILIAVPAALRTGQRKPRVGTGTETVEVSVPVLAPEELPVALVVRRRGRADVPYRLWDGRLYAPCGPQPAGEGPQERLDGLVGSQWWDLVWNRGIRTDLIFDDDIAESRGKAAGGRLLQARFDGRVWLDEGGGRLSAWERAGEPVYTAPKDPFGRVARIDIITSISGNVGFSALQRDLAIGALRSAALPSEAVDPFSAHIDVLMPGAVRSDPVRGRLQASVDKADARIRSLEEDIARCNDALQRALEDMQLAEGEKERARKALCRWEHEAAVRSRRARAGMEGGES